LGRGGGQHQITTTARSVLENYFYQEYYASMSVIVCSVPPIDCLVVTPSLYRYIEEDYFSVAFIMLDIGIAIAKHEGISSKLKLAMRSYETYLSHILNLETHPSAVMLVVPDDFDIRLHLRLAKSFEPYFKLLNGGHVNKEIVSQLAQFAELYGGIAVPANISTADVSDVKCAKNANTCLEHIKTALELFSEHAEWIHLLGPSVSSILSHLYNDSRINSADTTGHRLDLISRMRNAGFTQLYLAYSRYLKRGLSKKVTSSPP